MLDIAQAYRRVRYLCRGFLDRKLPCWSIAGLKMLLLYFMRATIHRSGSHECFLRSREHAFDFCRDSAACAYRRHLRRRYSSPPRAYIQSTWVLLIWRYINNRISYFFLPTPSSYIAPERSCSQPSQINPQTKHYLHPPVAPSSPSA